MGGYEALLLQALADGGHGGGVGWQRDPRILRKWRAQSHLFLRNIGLIVLRKQVSLNVDFKLKCPQS